MSLAANERISFTLSNLQKHIPSDEGSRRRVQTFAADDQSDTRRSVAAAAGAATSFEDVESPISHDYVDALKTIHHPPPPKLKNRKCCCLLTIILMWTSFSTLLLFATLLNINDLAYFRSSEEAVTGRRISRDSNIRDFVLFGIWDSKVAITPLQLQVAVSVALGVRADDDDVYVKSDDESFFVVRVEHATDEETEYIASNGFLEKLNRQLTFYGGLGVVSRQPKLHKSVPIRN